MLRRKFLPLRVATIFKGDKNNFDEFTLKQYSSLASKEDRLASNLLFTVIREIIVPVQLVISFSQLFLPFFMKWFCIPNQYRSLLKGKNVFQQVFCLQCRGLIWSSWMWESKTEVTRQNHPMKHQDFFPLTSPNSCLS